jgi:creatine kinase
MEKQSVAALKSLTGELAGEYFPLEGMTKETQAKLTADHFNYHRRLKHYGLVTV